MFFDNIDKIPEIVKKNGFSIFVVSNMPEIKMQNAIYLRPDEKTKKINIESVRDILALTSTKKLSDQFFIVEYPEKMSPEASNAFLKNLEEPKENYHFVFLTKDLSALLPTILSRAQIFVEKKLNILETIEENDEKIKQFAKRLMVADGKELVKLSKEIGDKKDRIYAERVVVTAIEICYKSYFKNKDERLLKPLPKLITLYENISLNGNIKLHIVADML